MWATSELYASRSRAGFTLIELLVVLAISAALLLVALPRLGGGEALLHGQRQAREIGAQLGQARSRAIIRQQPVTVTLSSAVLTPTLGRSYRLHADWQLQHADGARIADDQPIHIRFFPDGSSSGGAVQLSDGDRHFRLAVEWLTGRVRIDAHQAG